MRHRCGPAFKPTFALLPLFLLACGADRNEGSPEEPEPPLSEPGDGYFESSTQNGVPTGAAGPAAGPGRPVAAPTPGAAPTVPGADGGDNAAREIAEADIIQLRGSLLYAMSRTGGLSVIDVSNPSALRVLGRYRTSFTPFEMYVRDDVVFAMYSDWGEFVQDPATENWVWRQTSSLLALDVSEPANIEKISHFDLPGEISDSRLVGDVLYTVSYQNGSCWGCNVKPATNVVSIDVTKPSEPRKVDELAFESETQYGWGKRSISVTDQRIYVAGPEHGTSQPQFSTIQVVDISDRAGDLVPGTTVKIRGQITNRWQMDEYAGTLRVISQPWSWWNQVVPPAVETFTVESSQKVVPLARLDVTLPRPEALQSVRFDAERGYAVTFERTDPLFTFDLSNPAAPKQMGELEMPGFLYHMEPRGDRLIGLGYDQGNENGAITVSIFDVSDLSKPSMLERVNFGGTWGHLPEDQDRIHKVFRLDEENGLMLVPFAGWQQANDATGCGKSLNGVQLIDWAGDALKLRGMTKSLGQARRAFVANNALFTVADQEVAAYDIANRDAPAQLSAAPLALNVSLTLPTGDRIVRLRQDWYSQDMRIEVVPRETPDTLVAPITFNLTDYLRSQHGLSDCGYWHPSEEPLFAVGDTVYVLINDYGQWQVDAGYAKSRSLLVGFSSTSGEVTGALELPFQAGYWGWHNTSRVVRGDVVYLMQGSYDTDQARRLVAVDLSTPAKPRLGATLALPSNDYYGSTGLLESGNELATSYARQVPNRPGALQHFVVRVDVSKPLAPRVVQTVNVPGYLVDFESSTNSAVTLDHQPVNVPASSWEECRTRLPSGWFDQAATLCRGQSATLHRIELTAFRAYVRRSVRNDDLVWATPRRGDGRLFFTGGGQYGYVTGPALDSAYGGWGWGWAEQNITAVDSETLASSKVKAPGVWNVLALGQSLILAPSAGQSLTVIDAKDIDKLVIRSSEETALGYTNHLAVSGSDVYLSQGDGGVQHMTLP